VKFLPLIWSGLWRKPVRTAFLLVSLSVAFLLFGLLQGVDSAFEDFIDRQRLDRLLTDPRSARELPLAHVAQIEKLPGVEQVAWTQFLPGSYQRPSNRVFVVTTVPERWFAVRNEYSVSQEALEAMKLTRDGLLITPTTAERFGWKVGDRVGFQTQTARRNGDTSWSFQIVGLFHNPEGMASGFLLANYAFLDEARAQATGTISRILVMIANPRRSVESARAIDGLFANSPHPTRTKSESEMVERYIANLGDVKFFTRAIISAVFFALLFLAINTLLESIRERTPELAVLKTVGYSDRRVFAMVLAESLLLCLMAAAIGLTAAAALFPLAEAFISLRALPPIVFALGAGVAVALAVISAFLPAWRAKRLSIVEALAVR
jgi:putative ABC transport system permease protein